jgi:hypothetical protein
MTSGQTTAGFGLDETIDVSDDAVTNAKQAYIRSWLSHNGPATLSELCDNIAYDDAVIRSILQKTSSESAIVQTPDGYIVDPDAVNTTSDSDSSSSSNSNFDADSEPDSSDTEAQSDTTA